MRLQYNKLATVLKGGERPLQPQPESLKNYKKEDRIING